MGIQVEKSDDYDDPQAILKVMTQAFFTNVAQRQFNGTYTNLAVPSANGLEIHPGSILSNLKPKIVLYHELIVVGTADGFTKRKFMTEVSQIELEWLFDLVPN